MDDDSYDEFSFDNLARYYGLEKGPSYQLQSTDPNTWYPFETGNEIEFTSLGQLDQFDFGPPVSNRSASAQVFQQPDAVDDLLQIDDETIWPSVSEVQDSLQALTPAHSLATSSVPDNLNLGGQYQVSPTSFHLAKNPKTSQASDAPVLPLASDAQDLPLQPVSILRELFRFGFIAGQGYPQRPPVLSCTYIPSGLTLLACLFVHVDDLADPARQLFGFPFFNAVQTICLPTVLQSDDDVVISAPTGSGKTVLFELAIIRMLQTDKDAKAVYMAPTKALCNEKFRDWSNRFSLLDCQVSELTGDSLLGLESAKNSRLIISTPERWDSMTRRWSEQSHVLHKVRLFLIDEVHILSEPNRGACLEVVVSRIKLYGNNVRFVALSATVPNLEDIAVWIGSQPKDKQRSDMAKMFRFGNEFRPCPLEKVGICETLASIFKWLICFFSSSTACFAQFVYGYPEAKSEFGFQSSLNDKLFDLIHRHAQGRPCLIFVATRKSSMEAAKVISRSYAHLAAQGGPLPWKRPNQQRASFQDGELSDLNANGVAYHHAGMTLRDRREVEKRFLTEELSVVCCTSTLATGVNLPAFCVIIRGTKKFAGEWIDLPDLDFIQMIGRAGRPQFDRQGVVVVMCQEGDQEQRYRNLVEGTKDIESVFGKTIVEHINAEIGVKGKMSRTEIEQWLKSTFFFVRIQKNPRLYMDCSTSSTSSTDPLAILTDFCDKAISNLDEHALVDKSGTYSNVAVSSTEYGNIMSRFCLQYQTMLNLMKLDSKCGMQELLEAISQANEFRDMRFGQGEKAYLQPLRSHPEIRFPPKTVATVPDKILILLQATLSSINPDQVSKAHSSDFNPFSDVCQILRHAPRLVKAAMDIAIMRRHGFLCYTAFELLRSISARAWDGSAAVLKQLEGVGEISAKALAAAGMGSFDLLASSPPYKIELALNRNPPFGSKLIRAAEAIPKLDLKLEQTSCKPCKSEAQGSIRTFKMSVVVKNHQKAIKISKVSRMALSVCVLTLSANYDFFDFRRAPVSVLKTVETFQVSCQLSDRSQGVIVVAACDEIAGATVKVEFCPEPTGDSGFVRTSTETALGRDVPESDEENESFTLANQMDTGLTPQRAHFAEKLSNGNYRCRHSCKAGCKHACCHHGIKKPPKQSKDGNSLRSQADMSNDKLAVTESKQAKRRDVSVQDEESLLEKIDRLITLGEGVSSRNKVQMDAPSRPGKAKLQRHSSSSSSDAPLFLSFKKVKKEELLSDSDSDKLQSEDETEERTINMETLAEVKGKGKQRNFETPSKKERWAMARQSHLKPSSLSLEPRKSCAESEIPHTDRRQGQRDAENKDLEALLPPLPPDSEVRGGRGGMAMTNKDESPYKGVEKEETNANLGKDPEELELEAWIEANTVEMMDDIYPPT